MTNAELERRQWLSASARLAARNTLRRPIRTGLTVGMVVLAVALVLLGQAWISGVMGGAVSAATAIGGHVRVVKQAYAAREELAPLDENLPELSSLMTLLERQPGVVAVEPRITTGVTVTIGEELGDVFAQLIGGTDRYFRMQLRAHERLAQGRWLSGAEDELVIGARVAEQAGAKVGDELVLLGTTQDGALSPIKGRLVGVLGAGSAGLDQLILAPLEKVRYLTDIPEGATELLVFGANYRQGAAIAERLKTAPALAPYAVQAWSEREPWSSLGGTVRAMELTIIGVIVFLAALGVWNTMMMSVLERTHEMGVLRALGLSRLGAVGLFVGEALVIGVVGGALGVALGAGPAYLLETRGVHLGNQVAANSNLGIGETVYGDLSLQGALLSLGMGVLMAFIGSLFPALRAASIQPVTAMRTGR